MLRQPCLVVLRDNKREIGRWKVLLREPHRGLLRVDGPQHGSGAVQNHSVGMLARLVAMQDRSGGAQGGSARVQGQVAVVQGQVAVVQDQVALVHWEVAVGQGMMALPSLC